MASNINIQKKCEWCGKLFIAHKISTRCCSRRCANLAHVLQQHLGSSYSPLNHSKSTAQMAILHT